MSSYLRTGRQKPYYKSFNEIIQYLDQLSQMHSHLTVENFGFTAEGRPMKGVKVSVGKIHRHKLIKHFFV
uniref:SJCHGC06892 protein n=1 Tax=Schistosoma japonicum TaxID=6182 RepID=Q5BS02_SCHJA|nr:SJCHGC06892 protein [Schistosoma japonicum]